MQSDLEREFKLNAPDANRTRSKIDYMPLLAVVAIVIFGLGFIVFLLTLRAEQ